MDAILIRGGRNEKGRIKMEKEKGQGKRFLKRGGNEISRREERNVRWKPLRWEMIYYYLYPFTIIRHEKFTKKHYFIICLSFSLCTRSLCFENSETLYILLNSHTTKLIDCFGNGKVCEIFTS